MPPPRTIKDHFKCPKPPLNLDARPKDPPNDHDLAVLVEPVSSSPLSEPPSSLHSPPSSTSTETGPNSQLRETLQSAINGFTNPIDPGSAERDSIKLGDSFFRGSSSSSQRVIKHGKEIIISSDGDDTDSADSLESPDDLFKKFMNSVGKKVEAPAEEPTLHPRKRLGLNTTDRSNIPHTLPPKYKFSLDSLVTDTVDDDETEAGVARAKSAFEKRSTETPTGASDSGQSRELHEDVLASALSDGGDDGNIQRLQRVLDAVRRTEALEQENSWSFFLEQVNTPLPPDFPRDSIPPACREAFLRGKLFRTLCSLSLG